MGTTSDSATKESTTAICPLHSLAAVGVCDRCGSFGCEQCFNRGDRRCPACVARDLPRFEAVPWDERRSLGRARAFLMTWWRVVSHPRQTFARMPPRNAAAWGPFSFALLCCLVRWVAPHLAVSVRLCRELLFQVQEGADAFVAMKGVLFMLGLVLGLPLGWAVLRVFILGALDHALLWLFRSASGGVEPTLRAACYSAAPVMFGGVVQVWWLAELWQAGLRFIAYRSVHQNRGVRTLLVLLVVLLTLVFYLAGNMVDSVIESGLDGMGRSLGIR